MLIKKPARIPPSTITGQAAWRERRNIIKQAAALGLGIAMNGMGVQAFAGDRDRRSNRIDARPSHYGKGLKLTEREHALSYTNYYEFGSGKGDASGSSGVLSKRPWTIRVEGECEKPGEIGIEDILTRFTQEERIYRLRCVEAWAMVIPWIGFPLGDLLKQFKPTSKANYVAFETLYDTDTMIGMLDAPYQEGLRIDEAMHPLTLLSTGMYGEVLPTQNGAPLRLVVPWKYGFKSIKSIVRIVFSEYMPDTTWPQLGPREYGFFANVNPNVDHPRWSQRNHRVIGSGLFAGKQETLLFNGYASEVAHLYSGMDLKAYF